MRSQCVRAEDQPGLLALEHTMNEWLNRCLDRRQLLREGFHREMLHAEDFIDSQSGEHFLVIHHQHTALLAQCRKLKPEIPTKVHHRQLSAAHVSNALYPTLNSGKQSLARPMQR